MNWPKAAMEIGTCAIIVFGLTYCITRPPPPSPSVECIKAGGVWVSSFVGYCQKAGMP